jgi:pyruvate/2-oxoacid:ferredoxin oxidoreductase beta subunit
VLVLAGDGGTYDIGFQCAERSAAERNENILYVCLDNEGYMNTGAQKSSSSTPRFARTGSTPGRQDHAKEEPGGDHGRPPACPMSATASIEPPVDDLLRKLQRARQTRGLRLLHLLIPCLEGWGLDEDAGLVAARAAVDCGAWPLLEVEDGERWTLNSQRRRPLGDYLALQRRYRDLSPERIADLQSDIDRQWQRLQALQSLQPAA